MTQNTPTAIKPLGRKSYGSVGHLPGSRLGSGDHRINDGQARICLEKTRDKHDFVVVQEKVDGSNVSVAKIGYDLVPLVRAGYRAESSPWEQHHMFASWVFKNYERFSFLEEGTRICGEWLAQAHGIRYTLPRGPFISFDLMVGAKRLLYEDPLVVKAREVTPWANTVHADNSAISIEDAMKLVGSTGMDGALDPPEGIVYRVERLGKVQFLGKYVRSDKVDGKYLPGLGADKALWNWTN